MTEMKIRSRQMMIIGEEKMVTCQERFVAGVLVAIEAAGPRGNLWEL